MAAAPTPSETDAPGAARVLERLQRSRLLVVTGKGGTGKSTLAAALGRILARAGARTLLLELDPRENLHQLLGCEPSGGSVLELGGGLLLQNLPSREALAAAVRQQLRIPLLARKVVQSPAFETVLEGAPGLKELAVLGHVAQRVTPAPGAAAAELDVVVLDAPATGHALALLDAPRLVSEVIHTGPFGRLAAELAAFVADRRQCAVVAVTLAEDMPVQETLELVEAMRARLGRAPELVLANAVLPPGAPRRELQSAHPQQQLWRRRRRINERELARLRQRIDLPLVELPMLPRERGPQLVAALASLLETRLEGLTR